MRSKLLISSALVAASQAASPSHYLFIFGDSYTTTGFNASAQPQPSLANPLGNPPYPGVTFDGRNAANTSYNENWVDFLVYNSSLDSTVGYNYAVGGNVVNVTALQTKRDPSRTLDFVDQEATFERTIQNVPWTGQNSVFLTWFGINDVSLQVFGDNTHPDDVARTLFQADVKSYYNLLNKLYLKGARKFVTIQVPPIWRAPENGYGNGDTAPRIKNLTAYWNNLVVNGRQTFLNQHPSASVSIVDPTNIFNQVLDNPSAYGASSASCVSYPYGQPCLWTDFIHTGVVIQQQFAKVVAPVVKQLY